MQPSEQKGFTLLEMVAVLVIAGVVLSMAFPELNRSLDRYRLFLACRELAGEIRLLQQRAVNGETDKLLYVSSQQVDRYQIKHHVNGTPGEVIKNVYLPEGIKFKSYTDRLWFSALGAPNVGAVYKLQNKSGQVFSISVAVATGRVRVQEDTKH